MNDFQLANEALQVQLDGLLASTRTSLRTAELNDAHKVQAPKPAGRVARLFGRK